LSLLCGIILLGGIGAFSFVGCGGDDKPFVVVYTSTDQVDTEAVFAAFEAKTGIEVKPVFDSEAQKTTGLAMRLAEEKARPQADVFWNNELSRTLSLLADDVLTPFDASLASGIPDEWKASDGSWAAFAWRSRVLVYNTENIQPADLPKTLHELTTEKWKGKVAIANPLFGTTAAHSAALACVWGEEEALDFFKALKANGVMVYEGNGVVRDAVANGEVLVGLTDTDDVLAGIGKNMKIGMAFLDQAKGDIGTLVMPNSVALVKGAPHAEEARKFIEHLLSAENEAKFSVPDRGWFSVRSASGWDIPGMPEKINAMDVDWNEVSAKTTEFSRKAAEVLD
jgi:iron(III) transport system substrate-binding protein